jgi:mono/diheme cytochrome c family protein
VDALALAPVAWNPSGLNVGKVVAVAEEGTNVAVFSDAGLTVFANGAPASSDGSIVAWRAAGAIEATDGDGTWLVGVDGDGHVRRARVGDGPEDISDRFGLASDKVQLVAGSSSASTAFLLENGVALSDGKNVTRWDGAPLAVAVSAKGAAMTADGGLRVFDAALHETDLALPDAAFVAYDGSGALFAATHHALFRVDGATAQLVWDAGTRQVRALSGAGSAVWLAVDADLALYEDGKLSVTSGGPIAPDAKISGSPSGDIWVVAGGALQRFQAQTATSGDEALWATNVRPIYAAICGNCHSAPGTAGKDSSGIDLSTYDAWNARKDKIYKRVVEQAGTATSMPPPSSGFTLTDAQRAAIAAWAKPSAVGP